MWFPSQSLLNNEMKNDTNIKMNSFPDLPEGPVLHKDCPRRKNSLDLLYRQCWRTGEWMES